MKEMNGELQQLVHNVVPEKSLRPGARTLNFEEKRKLSVVRPKPYRVSNIFNAVIIEPQSCAGILRP